MDVLSALRGEDDLRQKGGVSRMDIISTALTIICIIAIFSFGFFLGYREGMATMKRIDDNIIEEAKRQIYREE